MSRHIASERFSRTLQLATMAYFKLDYVVDIQGFRDANNKFLPKEVAIVALQEGILDHWIVLPPCDFLDLPLDVRQTNTYCSLYIHGLHWFDGDLLIPQLRRHLYRIAKIAERIYVRGREKAVYLESVMGRRVIDIESYSVPSFRDLEMQFPKLSASCSSHAMRHFHPHKLNFCSLYKVSLIKKWLKALLKESGDYHSAHSELFYNALLEYHVEKEMDKKDNDLSGRDVVDNAADQKIYINTDGEDPETEEEVTESSEEDLGEHSGETLV